MQVIKWVGGLVLSAVIMTPASASTFFNTQSAFDTATAGITFTLDDFSTEIADADSITLSSGVVSTNIGGNRFAGFDNVVSTDPLFGDFQLRYRNAVDGDGGSASRSITWVFPQAITAFSFDYIGVSEDLLNVTVDGVTRAIRESADGDPVVGFFGVTSATPFTSLVFGTFSPDSSALFSLNTLRFGAAPAPPPAIPAPASLPLLLAGLAGLGVLERRRRAG